MGYLKKFIRNTILFFKISLIILIFPMKNLEVISQYVMKQFINYNHQKIFSTIWYLNTQSLHLVVQRKLGTDIMRAFAQCKYNKKSLNFLFAAFKVMHYVHFTVENLTSGRGMKCIVRVAQLRILSQCPKANFHALYRAFPPPVLQL